MPRSPVTTVRKAPKQERSRRLVEAILEAAARILDEGVEPFTTNHIALRAGASIGSLYQYFPSADAIMAALIEKHVANERDASNAILSSARGGLAKVMRDLLVGYINAHADAPRLTARLHALAPGFNLQVQLGRARDVQAAQIARALRLPKADVLMAVMAVEGVVLATLASHPRRLKADAFVDRLYSMALAPLVLKSNQGGRAKVLRTPRRSQRRSSARAKTHQAKS